MKKKLKGRGGYTLTEILIVVAIVAIIAAAGAVTTTAVISARNSMIEAADAQILGSTAAQAIADELRFGQNIKINKDEVTLDSTAFGDNVCIKLDGSGRLAVAVDGGTETQMMLAASAYSGLKISKLTFEKDGTGTGVTVNITVSGRNGEDKWSESFSVVPLNGIDTTA